MNVQEKLAQIQGTTAPAERPSELVSRLMATERPSEVLPFPRNDANGKPLFSYRMCVLTQQELDSARSNAEKYTREMLRATNKGFTDEQIANVRHEAWTEIYEDAKCYELLRVAMREVDFTEAKVGMGSEETIRKFLPLFSSVKQMRDLLTTDEAIELFNAYSNVKARYAPLIMELTDDECEAWIEKLTEGAESYPFLHSAREVLIQLVVSMAYRLRASKTATGSSGSPSSDTPTEPSPIPSPESV